MFLNAIDMVKKEIKGKNVVVKLYDKLKEDFVSFVHSSKTEKTKQESTRTTKWKTIKKPLAYGVPSF